MLSRSAYSLLPEAAPRNTSCHPPGPTRELCPVDAFRDTLTSKVAVHLPYSTIAAAGGIEAVVRVYAAAVRHEEPPYSRVAGGVAFEGVRGGVPFSLKWETSRRKHGLMLNLGLGSTATRFTDCTSARARASCVVIVVRRRHDRR